MRNALVLFSVLASSNAFAFDSTTEDVVFNARGSLFKGMDYSVRIPENSPIGLRFSADTDAEVAMDMGADSELTWPSGLSHGWLGIVRGGGLDMTVVTRLRAEIYVDFFSNLPISLSFFEKTFTWAGTKEFDSVLLPGGSNQATVGLSAQDLLGGLLDFTVYENEDFAISLGGNVLPAAYATVRGESITTNGQAVTDRSAKATLPTPSNNTGTIPMLAEWQGTIEGTYGLELNPWLSVTIFNDGSPMTLTLNQFRYYWDLGEQAPTTMKSAVADFTHAVPAVGSVGTIDLGEVEVGTEVEVDISIRNLGDIELIADATFAGDDVIYLVEDAFEATRTQPGTLTVAFAPDEEGDFSGTITLVSNDPVRPTITIPVRGEAFPPPSNDGDIDGDLGGPKGCGCSSAPAAPASLFGLALLGLAIRRRRS